MIVGCWNEKRKAIAKSTKCLGNTIGAVRNVVCTVMTGSVVRRDKHSGTYATQTIGLGCTSRAAGNVIDT